MIRQLKRWQIALFTLAAVLSITLANCAQQTAPTTGTSPTASGAAATALVQ